MNDRMVYHRPVGIYKPSDKGNGSAFQFRKAYKGNTPVLMIDACAQSGRKPAAGSKDSAFNWKEEKISMMFNSAECGEIAAYIVNMQRSSKILKSGIEMLHKIDRNKSEVISKMSLKKPDPDNTYGNWGMNISQKVGDNGRRTVSIFLSGGDVYRLKCLCDDIIMHNACGDMYDG